MKLLFDFFPVILFFIAYKVFPSLPAEAAEQINQATGLGLDPATQSHAILFATLIAIAASFLQVSLYRIRHGRFERMHLISLGMFDFDSLLTSRYALEDWETAFQNLRDKKDVKALLCPNGFDW